MSRSAKKSKNRPRPGREIATSPKPAEQKDTASSPTAPLIHMPDCEPLMTSLMFWGALSLVGLVFSLQTGTSSIRNTEFEAWIVMTLLSFEAASLFVLAAIPSSLLFVFCVLSKRYTQNTNLAQVSSNIASISIFSTVFFAYLLSWSMFRGTGQFLNLGAVQFWLANPWQTFQHITQMSSGEVILFPILSLMFGILVGVALPRFIRKRHRTSHRALAAAIASVVVLSVVSSFAGHRAMADDKGKLHESSFEVVWTRSEAYLFHRKELTGPASHIVSSLLENSAKNVEITNTASGDIDVIRRDQIPMTHYVGGVDQDKVKRWNVIILIVESLRPDQLQCFGGSRAVMPTVDALAESSAIFSNCYTQASHSSYADICPLSSHYPLRSVGAHLYPEDPDYPRVLIYDVLKHLGYRTGVFSSQNETWGNMINYLKTGNIDKFLHSVNYEGPTYLPSPGWGMNNFLKGKKPAGKIDDRFTVAESIKWLDEIGDAPFFIYMNLQNSHVPFIVPGDFERRFSPEKIDFPIRFGSFPKDKTDVVMNVYADSLAYVDLQIEKLFRFLKDSGKWDETIIVVTGDTGQAFYEHGFASHANKLYNEVMRVPLIIKAPQLGASQDHSPTQHIDVPPSIHHLLGIPSHPSYQGMNLFGPANRTDRSLFLLVQTPLADQYAIVKSDFKLIFDVKKQHHVLYNLADDAAEKRNIFESAPQVSEGLQRRLESWRNIQLEYYQNPLRLQRQYPPILAD